MTSFVTMFVETQAEQPCHGDVGGKFLMTVEHKPWGSDPGVCDSIKLRFCK